MKQTQRWIAFLLTLAMTFTLLPAAAFAADGADTSAEPAVVEEAAEEPVSVPETEEAAEEPVSAPETEEPAEPKETPQVSAAPAPQAEPQPQSDDNLVPYEKVINDMGATFELEQDTYEYTGQEIKPKMKPIMDGDYALRENIDYELVINDEDQNGVLLKAIEPGYYPLAVRGIGAYTGAYYGLYLHITPRTPSTTVKKDFTNGPDIILNWSNSGAGSYYYVERSVYGTDQRELIASRLQDTKWVDTTTQMNTTYTYFVYALNGNDRSDSDRLVVNTRPQLILSIATHADGLLASWSASKSPIVFHLKNNTTGKRYYNILPTTTSYLDAFEATAGNSYSYTLTAVYRDRDNRTYKLEATEEYTANPVPTITAHYWCDGVELDVNYRTPSYECKGLRHVVYIYRDGKLISSDSKSYYQDTTPVEEGGGKTYRYTVKVRHNHGKNFYNSALSKPVDIYVPKTMKITKLSVEPKGINVKWNLDRNIDGYQIWRRVNNGKMEFLNYLSAPKSGHYWDKSVKSGNTYTYAIRAYKTIGTTSKFSDVTNPSPKVTTGYIAAPTLKRIDNYNGSAGNGMMVIWSRNKQAKGYYVYRMDSNGTVLKTFKVSGNKTLQYLDRGVKYTTVNKAYTYAVAAYFTKYGKTYTSAKSNTKLYMRPSAPKIQVELSGNDIIVNWDRVSTAQGYYIWLKTGNGKWKKMRDVANNRKKFSYIFTKRKNGTLYTLKVESYYFPTGDLAWTNASKEVQQYFLSRPAIPTLTAVDAGIKVSWKKNGSASGYYIYRRSGREGWKKLKYVSGAKNTSYVDKTAKAGVKYRYYTLAHRKYKKKNYYSTRSPEGSIIKPKAARFVRTGNYDKGILLAWHRMDGATGYTIYYKKGNKWKKLLTTKDTSCVDTKVSAGTTYTYKVVTHCGSWSTGGSIVTITRLTTPKIKKISVDIVDGSPLVWTSCDFGKKAQGFRFYRTGSDGSSKEEKFNSTKYSFADSDLTPGVTYTYQIETYHGSSRSARSAAASITIPVT